MILKFIAIYTNPHDSWAIKKNHNKNIWASNKEQATQLFKDTYKDYDLIQILSPYIRKKYGNKKRK